MTPVPLAPAYLLGVTQLRGHTLPVLDASQLPGLSGLAPPGPAGGGQPTTASGRQALVVSATGLDSALAALEVTEIVGFERPSFAAPSGARPLWQGEEVAVLDVAAILAGLRPGVQPR